MIPQPQENLEGFPELEAQRAQWRERQQRYLQSEKGKAYRRRYLSSEAGKAQRKLDYERRRVEVRRLVEEAKASGCADCGRTDLPHEVLDFDHVFGPREFSPGQSYGVKRTEREIAKCQVRCPTCHALRHYNQRTAEHGRFN